MKYFMQRLCGVAALTIFVSLMASAARAAEPASNPAPLLGVPGQCLLQTDFASEPLDPAWKAVRGTWEVKDGALRGQEIPEQKHAAVLRHELAVHDFIATFVFRFDGGKAIKLVVNKDHAHIFAVSIWPNEMDVFKQPEKNKTFSQKTGMLDARKLEINTEQWHTATVEVIGKTVVASLDGQLILCGSHEGIDVDKTEVDFAANAKGAIKSIKFCRASAPADLEAATQRLQAARGKTAATQPSR